jgi:hydrogenase/urease accessory protein HupE
VSEVKTQASKSKPRWWTPYWIAIVISTIVLGIIIPLISHIPLETAVIYLVIALVFEGIAYYARVRPSISLNRAMYILLGVTIGGFLWLVSMIFLSRIYTQGLSEDVVIVIILIVCLGIGALIGDTIGRLRDYKGPEQYQP